MDVARRGGCTNFVQDRPSALRSQPSRLALCLPHRRPCNDGAPFTGLHGRLYNGWPNINI